MPERTNGTVSNTVEVLWVSVGSNPTPSAKFGCQNRPSTLASAAAQAIGRHVADRVDEVVLHCRRRALVDAVARVLVALDHDEVPVLQGLRHLAGPVERCR